MGLNSDVGDGGGSPSELPILELFWDSPYAIVVTLLEHYPDKNPTDIGLDELADLVEQLPGFSDDPALVNERFLLDIQSMWYEEKHA